MVPRLHSEFLPTLGVLLVVAFVVESLLTPPDPFTQLLYLGPGLVVVFALTGLFTYGGGFARLGLSPSGRDHAWTAVVFFAVVVLVGLFVPDPTNPVANAASVVVGLLVGAWVGWGGGRHRLVGRETGA